MVKVINKFLLLVVICISISSCKTSEKILYFQDVENAQVENMQAPINIKIKPMDKLSIIVTGKDEAMYPMFNLPTSMVQTSGSNNGNTLGYTVDPEGNIDFPLIGKLHVEGLSRPEVAELVRSRISDGYMKDAVVTVDYSNLIISVLGEVRTPGQIRLNRDRVTILDAISMAGDLTITGKRDRILVIREVNGKRTTNYIDIRSKELFNSPVYYLQQNDIVYVEPNRMKAGQSTINDNTMLSAGMWISIASFLASMGTLIFK